MPRENRVECIFFVQAQQVVKMECEAQNLVKVDCDFLGGRSLSRRWTVTFRGRRSIW